MNMTRDVLVRGDDQEWVVKLTDRLGNPLPIRDIEVVVVAKPLRSDRSDDLDILFRHAATFAADGSSLDAVGLRLGGVDPVTGEEVVDPDAGVVTEFLTPADIILLAATYDSTPGFGTKRLARWDMQVTDAQGRRKTLLNGELKMTRDVGRTD